MITTEVVRCICGKVLSPGALTIHSMLRLDATTKKRFDGKLFKFKKFSIKQAIFIKEIFPPRVKAPTQYSEE